MHLNHYLSYFIISLFFSGCFDGSAESKKYKNSITTLKNKTQIIANGKTYEIERGEVFQLESKRKKIDKLYEPDFLKNNYTKKNNKIFRIVKGHGHFQVQRSCTESFEDCKSVRDLIGPNLNWTSMTIQGQASPTISKYVELRHNILKGRSGFIDNKIEPSNKIRRVGKQSLKAFTKASRSNSHVNKASLDSELVYYGKGDHFWIHVWFYLEKGRPISLIDLESNYMKESPGIRIMLDRDMRPSVELKFAHKPTFKMDEKIKYTFPKNKWVEVKWHLYLMDSKMGHVELWMDQQKLIDQKGRTLTLFDAVYNSLQVGITAAPVNQDTVLYIDDLKFNDSEL